MHDLVIRGGTVVDGTGAPAGTADVAVRDGLVVEVGPKAGPGRREVDAAGLLVTPGFIDIHTHYDGQATWDPEITPSSWHGVTTTVFGNCGVGFAPVRPGAEPYLINLMEGVEDIPGTVLAEGVDFRWESFPEYLDVLDSMPRCLDVGAQVPHGALRFYVMGERGADHAAVPTEAEIARMGELLEQALKAGALGFTTSRTRKHKAKDGRFTPGLSAAEPELYGLAQAMRRAGSGVLEVNSDFGPGEFETMQAAAAVAGRPLSVLLIQINHQPGLWRETLDQVRAARAVGIDANAQVGCRPIGLLMGLETSINPFITHPEWPAVADLPPAGRYGRLAADEGLRHRLVAERPDDEHTRWMQSVFERAWLLDDRLDYEPDPARSVLSIAGREGRDPFAVALDMMLGENGKGIVMHTFENYTGGSLDVVRQMLTDDATVMGVGDGGAHVGLICDASSPTTLLSHWARDRSRGEQLPIEFLVHKQTQVSAAAYGMLDRGVLAPGYRADMNVIDFDRLRLRRPEVVYDLPTGGKRIIQRADGYRHTFVRGVETLRDGQHTGERPGRLVRGPQKAPG